MQRLGFEAEGQSWQNSDLLTLRTENCFFCSFVMFFCLQTTSFKCILVHLFYSFYQPIAVKRTWDVIQSFKFIGWSLFGHSLMICGWWTKEWHHEYKLLLILYMVTGLSQLNSSSTLYKVYKVTFLQYWSAAARGLLHSLTAGHNVCQYCG